MRGGARPDRPRAIIHGTIRRTKSIAQKKICPASPSSGESSAATSAVWGTATPSSTDVEDSHVSPVSEAEAPGLESAETRLTASITRQPSVVRMPPSTLAVCGESDALRDSRSIAFVTWVYFHLSGEATGGPGAIHHEVVCYVGPTELDVPGDGPVLSLTLPESRYLKLLVK